MTRTGDEYIAGKSRAMLHAGYGFDPLVLSGDAAGDMELLARSARTLLIALALLAPAANVFSGERFEAEERVFRKTLAANPLDRTALLGIARIHLWRAQYRLAEREFEKLVASKPGDPDALLGWAQAAYWSGDFRAAKRRFQRLVEVDSSNAEARKALDDLRIVMLPRYEVSAGASDDTQPMQRIGTSAKLFYFSDPLTRWDAHVSGVRLENETTSRSLTARSVAGGVRTGIPALRLTVSASAEVLRFDDDTSEFLAGASLVRPVGTGEVTLTADQFPLLGTVTSIVDRETATRYRLSYRHEPERGWLGAVSAHHIRYSDSNRGRGADAYVLFPLPRIGGGESGSSRLLLRAGVSAAWRDTEEDRFRFTSFRSEPISGGFVYRFSGVYDPYWTPHDLREARLVGSLETSAGAVKIKLQADGGLARERYRGFGPATGATAIPQFTFPIMLERTHHPWRGSVELAVPMRGRAELRARFRHEAAAFYDVNEFEASVGGHL